MRAHLFVRNQFSHADEYVPNLGSPDVHIVVQIQELEGSGNFGVAELGRPVRRVYSCMDNKYSPLTVCRPEESGTSAPEIPVAFVGIRKCIAYVSLLCVSMFRARCTLLRHSPARCYRRVPHTK